MTDKVQKIKEWISKEQEGLMDAQGNFEYPEHEGAYHILCNLDAYINSLQEEPVSEELIIELKSIVNIRELAHQGIPVIKIARHIANWQKEKDNELTWEDMFDIFRLVNVVLDDYADGKTKKEVGEEVLRRFKESR